MWCLNRKMNTWKWLQRRKFQLVAQACLIIWKILLIRTEYWLKVSISDQWNGIEPSWSVGFIWNYLPCFLFFFIFFLPTWRTPVLLLWIFIWILIKAWFILIFFRDYSLSPLPGSTRWWTRLCLLCNKQTIIQNQLRNRCWDGRIL